MSEHKGDVAADRLTAKIEQRIGPPIKVTDEVLAAARESGDFGTVIFELYREATGLLAMCSSSQLGLTSDDIRFPRNQAICVGLLVRIAKLMTSSMKLSSGMEHTETVLVLNRCILESAINLRFLLAKDDGHLYQKFVTTSLRTEKEFFDQIQSNIVARGGTKYQIEEQMIISIRNTLEASGVKLEDVDTKAASWGGNMREKLKSLDMESAYIALHMIPSHSVHGDWFDLVKYHLVKQGDQFKPNTDWAQTDGELLSGAAVMSLEATEHYLNHFFEPHMINPLTDRIADLRNRLLNLELARDDWRPA